MAHSVNSLERITATSPVEATSTPPMTLSQSGILPTDLAGIRRLIATIRNRPKLWMRCGQTQTDYKVLWNEVSQEMNLPVGLCRYKWRMLRNTFRRRKKYQLTTLRPVWCFYDDMRFIENHLDGEFVSPSSTIHKSDLRHTSTPNTPNIFGIDIKNCISNVAELSEDTVIEDTVTDEIEVLKHNKTEKKNAQKVVQTKAEDSISLKDSGDGIANNLAFADITSDIETELEVHNPELKQNDDVTQIKTKDSQLMLVCLKPKMQTKVVKSLIAAIKSRPLLWMHNHIINGEKRRGLLPIWKEVSKEVELTINVCQFKWKSLRSTFLQKYKYNHKSWRFYDDMRFLEKIWARKIEYKPEVLNVNNEVSISEDDTREDQPVKDLAVDNTTNYKIMGYNNVNIRTVDVVRNLIAAVKRRPKLWIRNPIINGETIWKLWNEISVEVVLPIQICQFKWKSLRATFMTKYKNNRTTWRFYDDMRFLVRKTLHKQTPNDFGEDTITDENSSNLVTKDSLPEQKDANTLDNATNNRICNTEEISINEVMISVAVKKNLIAAVKHRPELWMRNHIKKGEVRRPIKLLWDEVGEEMKLPIHICRHKWRILRNTFLHMYKYKQTAWSFYGDMCFLEKVFARRVIPKVLDNTSYNPDPTTIYEGINTTSDDFMKRLIAAVKSKPKLWMRTHIKTDGKCRPVLSPWNEVSREMKLPIKICQHKWKSLRSNFLKRYRYKQTTWRFYDDMRFLEKVCTTKGLPQHKAVEQKVVSSAEKAKFKMVSDGKHFKIETLHNNDDKENPKKVDAVTQLNIEDSISLSGSKTGIMNDDDLSLNSNADHNNDRVFLLSFVPHMQKLNERQRLRLRQRLQNAVIEEFN